MASRALIFALSACFVFSSIELLCAQTPLPKSDAGKDEYRIRLVYFVPTDREPTADYEKKIRVVMHFVKELYRQDIDERKIPGAKLLFQEENGEPKVHLVRGSRPAVFYSRRDKDYDVYRQWETIPREIPASVGVPRKNLLVIFAETYDFGEHPFEWPGGVAVGDRFSSSGGIGLFSAWILRDELCKTDVDEQKKWFFDETPVEGRSALGHGRPNSPRFELIEDGFGAVAHELGHALGLPHDIRRDEIDIMCNGFRNMRWNLSDKPEAKERRARFSDDNARMLYTSRYLHASDLVLTDNEPPKIEAKWAAPLKAGDKQVRVSFTATDNEDLRALLFFSIEQDTIEGGKKLSGKEEKGEMTLDLFEPLKPGPFNMDVTISDAGGNQVKFYLKGKAAE